MSIKYVYGDDKNLNKIFVVVKIVQKKLEFHNILKNTYNIPKSNNFEKNRKEKFICRRITNIFVVKCWLYV